MLNLKKNLMYKILNFSNGIFVKKKIQLKYAHRLAIPMIFIQTKNLFSLCISVHFGGL